jgi:hypothetical protein
MLRAITAAVVLFLLSISSWAAVVVTVSVDWEGRDLNQANLNAMSSFRSRFPQIPLLQFLNAAYFTKPDANKEMVAREIRSVLRPSDELGLHVHAWRRLLEASGVHFHKSPTFNGGPDPRENCEYDCGHGVPISTYTQDELRRIFHFSLDTLEGSGFGRARAFRAGGWMATRDVMEALSSEGIHVDASAVHVPLLAEKMKNYPILEWLQELWRPILATAQPFRVVTQNGALMELPDNGALADYVDAPTMLRVFSANAALAKDRDIYVQFGFHQETAALLLDRFSQGIRLIIDYASASKIPIRFSSRPLSE